MIDTTYKGFTRSHLEWAYSVRFTDEGVVVPYFTQDGSSYREKLMSPEGKAVRWLGESSAQVPYGLETLGHPRPVAFLTEGESCAWALRAAYPQTPILGLPGASSWRPEWAGLLEETPVIYLSFDADPAGHKLTDAVWPSLPWARRVKLPAGTDTRDVLQGRGLAAYNRLLRDADYIAGCTRYLLEAGRPLSLGTEHVATSGAREGVAS